MHTVFVLVAVLAVAAAYPGVPAQPGPPDDEGKESGLMQFRYSSPDGAHREETVRLRRVGGQTVPHVRGRVRWTSPEGRAFEMRYEADENGYRVRSREPTAPASAHAPAKGEEHWPSPAAPPAPHPHRATAAPAPPAGAYQPEDAPPPPPGRRPGVVAPAPPPKRSLHWLDVFITPPPGVEWRRVRH